VPTSPATARISAGIFSSRSDEWNTPPALATALARRYAQGSFALDAAATSANSRASRYYDAATDALRQDWVADAGPDGVVWLNPPYSKVALFFEKAASTARQGTTVVCLVPARVDTAWWHDHALSASEVWFVRGRVTFTRPDGTGAPAPFPSAVIVFSRHSSHLPQFGTLDRAGKVISRQADLTVVS